MTYRDRPQGFARRTNCVGRSSERGRRRAAAFPFAGAARRRAHSHFRRGTGERGSGGPLPQSGATRTAATAVGAPVSRSSCRARHRCGDVGRGGRHRAARAVPTQRPARGNSCIIGAVAHAGGTRRLDGARALALFAGFLPAVRRQHAQRLAVLGRFLPRRFGLTRRADAAVSGFATCVGVSFQVRRYVLKLCEPRANCVYGLSGRYVSVRGS